MANGAATGWKRLSRSRGRTQRAFGIGFFFQAEDGIRDADVTGVQTCALPILAAGSITLSVTAVDGDGDEVTETINLGGNLEFLDDGPSITVDTTGLDTVTVDETKIGRASYRERV